MEKCVDFGNLHCRLSWYEFRQCSLAPSILSFAFSFLVLVACIRCICLCNRQRLRYKRKRRILPREAAFQWVFDANQRNAFNSHGNRACTIYAVVLLLLFLVLIWWFSLLSTLNTVCKWFATSENGHTPWSGVNCSTNKSWRFELKSTEYVCLVVIWTGKKAETEKGSRKNVPAMTNSLSLFLEHFIKWNLLANVSLDELLHQIRRPIATQLHIRNHHTKLKMFAFIILSTLFTAFVHLLILVFSRFVSVRKCAPFDFIRTDNQPLLLYVGIYFAIYTKMKETYFISFPLGLIIIYFASFSGPSFYSVELQGFIVAHSIFVYIFQLASNTTSTRCAGI